MPQGARETDASALAAALRTPVFAVAATGLAVGAHMAGGGAAPSVPMAVQFTTFVPGHAVAQQVVLPAPGTWSLNVQVVAADGVADYSATTLLTVT